MLGPRGPCFGVLTASIIGTRLTHLMVVNLVPPFTKTCTALPPNYGLSSLIPNSLGRSFSHHLEFARLRGGFAQHFRFQSFRL